MFLVVALLAGCAVSDEAPSGLSSLPAERTPLPQDFNLISTALRAGQPATFAVQFGPPSASVRLARAVGGGVGAGPCPPVLGGGCLDITGPQGVELFPFSISTNASGNGSVTVIVPAGVPDGVPVALQAVHPASGAGSVPAVVVTGPPLAVCDVDSFEPNGDAFAVLSGPAPVVSSVVSSGADVDWYAFHAVAGQIIRVDVLFTHDNAAQIDLDVHLTAGPFSRADARRSGNYLARGISGNDDELAVATATTTGTHYVMVDNWHSGTLNCADYELEVTVQ